MPLLNHLKPDDEMTPHIGRTRKGESPPAARYGPFDRFGASPFLFCAREMVDTSGFACPDRAMARAVAPGFTVRDAVRFPRGMRRSVVGVELMDKGFQIGRGKVGSDDIRMIDNPKAGFGGSVTGCSPAVASLTDRAHLIENAMVSKFATSPAAGDDPGG